MSSAALLAGLMFLPGGSHAAQLAYEGFDYATGSGNLTNQLGGSGWNGAWQTVNNGSADVVTGSLTAAANAPAGFDLRSIGNSCNLPNQRRIGRKLDTSAAGPFGVKGYRDANGRIGADGKTIYLSFIQQANGTSAYYEFEFHRGDLGDPGRIAGIGNDQGGDNVNLRAPNGTHTPIGAGDTGVNFYVVRIDFKPGDDDVYVYRNPTSATEPGVPTLLRTAAADMSFDGLSFGAFNNGRTVAHDEVRLGESWADVTVPATAQPVITSQPRAATTSYVGGTVVLTAEASGQPLPTYQWFKGVNPISGQTGTSLTLSNVQATDAAAYHVTATNSQGSASSSNAQVTVLTTPPGLLAYEGFDYNAGSGNLAGKAGGLGWGAAWANINGGGTNVASGNLAAGTNAPNGYDTQSLGNSAQVPNGQRDGRLVDTSPGGRFGTAGYVDGNGNIGADGKTIYLSFLQQPDGTPLFYEFEFHRGDLGDPGRIGGIGNDTNLANVYLRTGPTQNLIGPGSTAVNLYVVRIDFKPGNDDVYVYQNPVSATEPATATLTTLGASDMSFNGVSLAAFVNNRTVKHDEIRFGQSWSDVVFGTSRRQLAWVGDGTTNAWNFSAPNWTAGSGPTAFVDGDPVTFDDTGSATPAVSIPANVSTASVTVNNSTKNYTLGGAGTINCSGGLIKSGTGSLTLNAPANFGNAVVFNDGSLILNSPATVGGDLNMTAGALTLSGTNTFTGSLNATAGTQTLSGTNTFSGLVAINGAITITGPTAVTGTGGTAIWIGNLTGANSSLTIQPGGSLNMTGAFSDSWVIGRDGGSGSVVQNGGTVTFSSPAPHDSAFIGASASGGTTASYTMNAGTLEMSTARLGLSIGPITSNLDQSGGTIKVRQLELGANLPTGTGIYNMTGGVLTVGEGGITSASGLYEINVGTSTIGAAADWSTTLAMNLTGGNVTFDSAGHRITLFGDLTGAGGVIKTGTGTLVLNGINGYFGATAVNAGTLAGFGNGDNSALTVASGASLAPGDGGVGSFYSGSTISLASGSKLELEVDSSAQFADQLSAGGNISLNGAILSVSEIVGGTLPLATELVIVTSATNITGTFAGTPEASVISAGANSYRIHYASNQVTLTTIAGSPYSTWASAHGLDGSPGKDPAFDSDPEHDGIANGLEWILGGNPLAVSSTPLLASTGTAANGITLNFTREETSLGGATLIVQYASNLGGTWTDVPVVQAGGSYPNGVTVTVNQANTPDGVTVHIPASNAVNGKLFARLRATMP